MNCSSKENSIKYLFENGATDSVRTVTDLGKFNELNAKLTELATVKYRLNTYGADLFTINYESKKFMDSPYYREATYTVARAMPNEILFEQLDMLIDEYESRTGEDQPMFMKAPEVDYSLKIVETLSKINRGAFETSKLQGWLNDLQKQGVSGQQLELFKEVAKPGMTKNEIAVAIAANYSYTVKINIAEKVYNPYEFDLNGDHYSVREDQDEGGWLYYRNYNDEISEDEYTSAQEQNEKENNNFKGYYSNLTVPGGTNYIENEIATPNIIPSIKGHAEFATDQGIGWFRSDDKSEGGQLGDKFDGYGNPYIDTIGGTPTKTRRILEVQSDLFQKGRDKDDLITIKSDGKLYSVPSEMYSNNKIGDTIEYENNFYKIVKEFEEIDEFRDITNPDKVYKSFKVELLSTKDNVNKNKNQFLQLLNKDNNWVTFFLKSIMQDSAKKGYEKVLFPTGNTASKVEGHSTLEEFKKEKEDRIKQIEVSIKTNKKYYDQVEEKEISLLKKLKTSDFLKKDDLGYIYNSKEKTVYLINKITNDEVKLSHGYWSNNIISKYVNSEKEAKLIFDKFINGENISDEDSVQNINQVIDIMSKDTIEDEIKRVKRDQAYYIKKNSDYELEIKQLKQELGRVEGPEGFGALKPIYNFYENTVTNILRKQFGKERVKQVTDEYGNTWNELTIEPNKDLDKIMFLKYSEEMGLPIFEYDLSILQNARTKEVATILAARLALTLKTNYINITEEEARNLLKNSPIPYQGEPAFFFAGTVYTVGENVNLNTVLHEFSHPLLQGIRKEKPALFKNLYTQLEGTTEGQQIIDYVKKAYPELPKGSDRFMEEALAHALQLSAVNKVTNTIETQGFDAFIKNLLFQIRELFRKAFGNKKAIKNINVNTTIDELADMLLEKDFQFETESISTEDAAMFSRFVKTRAKLLTDNASSNAVTESLNTLFAANNIVNERAKDFRSDAKTRAIVKKSLLIDGTTQLTPGVKKSLQGFQTIIKGKNQTVDEIIDDALDAETLRLKDLNNRSIALVTSLEITNNITKLIGEELSKLQKKTNFGSPSDIALLGLYKSSLTRWYQSISDIDAILKEDFALATDNAFSQLLGEITRNTIRGQEIITNLYKTHSIQFFVEITGYMSDFVKGELRTDLGNALKGTLTEQEFEDLYNKIVQQKIEDSDIESLTAKGIESKYINNFIDRYNYFIINENKIQDILEGKFKDISVFNRFLESYSSSNSPIVGSLAIYIENQKRQAEQRMWMKSLTFRKKLEVLLPQVSEFSKWNTRAMLDLLAEKDGIAHFNRKTGKMEKREVYSFLDEYGNGWRYDLDMLEFAVEEARNKGDVDGLKAAMKALRTFNIEYMNSEYTPEYYEKDAIFDSSPLAQEAWLDRKLALDEISAETNSLQNELERFDNYTTVDAAWDKYKQLYSLTYEDGTPKRDSPENEVFDLSKTLILREHRNLTKDYHEFVPMPGSLQTAYTEIINLWTSQGLKNDEINAKLKEWTKQNTKLVYSSKYYEENNRLRTRLAELQEKANEALDSDYDISAGYKRISDLIYGFKDEQGQPDPTALGVDKLKIIKDTQQEINDYRFAFDTSTGLSRTELEELKTYSQSLKIRKLTADEEARYMLLVTKQSKKGLTIEELAEMQGIFDELGDLSIKLATEYYLDTLNFNLSRFNIKAVTDETVGDFINTPDFLTAVESDKNFYDWFLLNHVTRKVWSKTAKKYVDKFERTSANSVTIPKDPSMILTTEILDERTGKPIQILGIPNAKHSIYTVKDKYRTIPFGLTAEEKKKYVGKIIDNRGNFLPKQYDGTAKGAKTDKYINKNYQALKKAGGARFELLQAVKKYHLENQEGKANMTKLYLDMPRYAIDSVVEAFQAGNYGQRFSQIKSNVGEYFKQKFGKSVMDVENGFNYDAENNLVNTDVNGEQISYIPVSGLYNLDSEKVSPDVFQGLMTYALSLETHDVLLQNLPLIESLIDSLSTPEAQPKHLNKNRKDLYKAKGILEGAKIKGTNQMLGQVKSLFEKEFFGVHNSDISEKYPKLSKLLGAMQKASTLSALAVNIPSDLKNKYGAMVQMIIEASGAEFINLKDLALGRAWAFKSMINWSSKKGIYAVGPPAFTTQMIEMFDPVFRTTDNMGRSISRSLFTDLINGEWMFMHRKFGEMEVGLTLFGSFLNAQKVNRVMPDGKTQSIKYMDAWELDSNGIIKLKSGIDPKWNNLNVNHAYVKGETLEQIAKQYGISVDELKAKNRITSTLELADGDTLIIAKSEAFDMFRNRVQGTSRALFGAYDKFGQPEGNKLALYRLYFFMRKWFTPMFVNRFGGEAVFEEGRWIPKIKARYDWATGTTKKGYYITAFQAMSKMLTSRGKSIKYLEEKEKIALKKASAEAMFIIVFALMTTLLFGYDDDDEDKWKKIGERSEAYGTDGYKAYGFVQNHMLNLLMGVNAETTAFVPLPKIAGINLGMDDYGKMLTSTSTAFGNTFLLYMEIIGDVLNMVTFNDAAKYQRDSGPYSWEQKDQYKIINNIMKAFGITGSTGDPETTTKNLRMSASRMGK